MIHIHFLLVINASIHDTNDITFPRHGRTKFATGAGLWALGAITGNQGWQNTGAGLAKLGLLSKLGAHFI